MRNYKARITFTTDYLQARFTEDAKKEIDNLISKGIAKTKDDSWAVLLHIDDNGIYIPSIQIRNAMINAGKEYKVKKQRRSMQQWCISNLIIQPDCIYFGKTTPDKVVTSYPARKDGNRVEIKHPAILANTLVEFTIKVLDGDMEEEAILNVLKTAGTMYGIGARRRDMFGRFEVTSFEEVR